MAYNRKSKDADDVQWNGRVYRRHPHHQNRSMRCYFMATIAPRNYLHRDIFEEAYGPIADNWHVHHVDGNSLNNELSNLALLSPEAHARHHHSYNDEIEVNCFGCGKSFYAKLKRAKWCSPKCKEQKRRDSGLAYVRPSQAKLYEKVCNQCAKSFMAKKPWGRFCQSACKSQYAREQLK